ncbi:LacI family DNA-binding transcriptional regulator [Streptomyces sp. HYC2]|uniref:LacI family DNA-binding transcriptional regulator n=1 Tax=Streptomyces sp. HYC2 TaxID=2955207 RepID=UPI00248163D7|nr:LacI family DNA-binding transcriptional regulator [Streptomyces sp. HYC2]
MTLSNVAREAGVSLATASRALNGSTQVRLELRERVLAAAARLDYTPNAHAKALASAASHTIGLICHDISDPYFAGIAGGVMRGADEQNLQVILASTFRDPSREIEYVSMMRGQQVRAILLVGSSFEDRAWQAAMRRELDLFTRSGGRVAAVSRHQGLRVDTVQPENRAGAAELARSLVALGHRDFAVLSGPKQITTVTDRLRGFRQGLADAGIPLPADRIFIAPFTREGGYQAALQLLADSRGTLPSCVIAVTDIMAVGALAAFRDQGLAVPDDIALTGFDDIPAISDLTPPLTSVALPLEELGRRVMQLVLREAGSRARVDRVPAQVVLRASTPARTATAIRTEQP